MDPCVWMAKSYVAVSRCADFASAVSTSPRSLVTSSLTICVERTWSQILVSSGSPCQSDQVAFSCLAAVVGAPTLPPVPKQATGRS
jgi:hypothetical protein